MKKAILTNLLLLALVVALVAGCGSPAATPSPAPAPPAAGSSPADTASTDGVDFPTRPITLVIPFDLGSADTEARLFAQHMERHLGQTIVGVNIVGGSGAVGLENVMQSEPDGYTIGFMSATIAFGMALDNIRTRPEEVQVIGSFNADWMGLFVPEDSPFYTFVEFAAFARENPGHLLVGGTNVASAHHSFMVTLANDAEIDVTYVPYGGASDTILALLGGNLDAAVSSPNAIRQFMESDGVRLLVYSTRERVPEFADIPTAYELGFSNLNDMMQFRAFYTSPGVPEEILQILDKAFELAAHDPEYLQHLENNNITPFFQNRHDFSNFLIEFVEVSRAAFEQIEN